MYLFISNDWLNWPIILHRNHLPAAGSLVWTLLDPLLASTPLSGWLPHAKGHGAEQQELVCFTLHFKCNLGQNFDLTGLESREDDVCETSERLRMCEKSNF